MKERSDFLKTEDLRVKKTKKILKDTFKELFLEKDYEKIQIKELCERAMINRRTFHLHYNTMDDLLAEVLDEIADDFYEMTKDYDHFANPKRIVRDYFVFTHNNPLFEKINNNLDYNYIREIINGKVSQRAQLNFQSIAHYDMNEMRILATFLNATTVNIYRQWCFDGKKAPMEEVIEMTGKLILNGLQEALK